MFIFAITTDIKKTVFIINIFKKRKIDLLHNLEVTSAIQVTGAWEPGYEKTGQQTKV